MVVALTLPLASHAQDTGYISGTVSDKSGAAVPGAEVAITSVGGNLTRTTTTNADGAYVVAALPGSTYNLSVTAKGFEKYQAKNVKLDVAQKIRVDVQLTVGQVTEQVVVEGTSVAQVETQSSDLGGTILGSQITQLQLNGRNFTQLATLVPGVTNEGPDEGKVGVTNIYFSFNGGRLEYNNWELDGGDNMDNGSNQTLNVYPSVDAIAEVKVLTSNYGAQYGRNSSGTVEVETKSGTNKFHGDVYYFGRNDFFNARNFFDPAADANGRPLGAPPFKKHDYGYTIGGPVFIPNHYNANKQKTFFFFSEEWRRDLVPGQSFLQGVPSLAERGIVSGSQTGFGNFSDVCPGPDCPNVSNPAAVPIDPNAQAILAEIPLPNAPGSVCGAGIVACFNSSPAQATKWREELVRLDHNFTSKEQLTFRYIHDSWSTVTPTTLWACPDGCSFPTIQTSFVGPGTSTVARLTSTLTPTLLNEFVASYTADHIFLTNVGPGAVARSSVTPKMTMTGLFPFSDKLPGFKVTGNSSIYGGAFEDDQAYIPWNNANPTYTLRDNVTKVAGTHTLQFGAYAVIAQKNEQSSFGDTQGFLTFDATNSVVSTGNAFADLLLGRIAKFQQANRAPKYYFRYQIAEPYFQDDWRITSHFTLNLGVRVSLFGTYREKYKHAFNFEPSVFNPASAPAIFNNPNNPNDPNNGALIDPTTQAFLTFTDPRVFNGIVQCGATGQPAGCVQGHLFNPAPRIGFAWDPWGNGKTSVRGGYGMFFEHGNGNEQNVEVLEATAPFVLNPSQPNITGYTNIGAGGANAFPLSFNAIGTRGVWPNVQQWNLNVQHELPQHIVASIAYAGSNGTHLGLRREFNQVQPVPLSQNPYKPGEPIGGTNGTHDDCGTMTTPSGVAITGQAAINLGIACGGDPNPNRPFLGFGGINGVQYVADSNYNSLQVSVRRAIAPLILSLAYTYSHSIDNASTGGAGNPAALVNSYDAQRARASSDFDQRHTLNISYVYDLPSYWKTGLAHGLFGDWQFSGVTTIQTGTPFDIITTGISDNAGVGNGSGPGVFADLVGDPHGSFTGTSGPGPQLYNPNAFAAPRGLTFGNVGRNILHVPRRTNFDMSLLKHFKINESTGIEFRAEAFNIFNHTQWGGSVLGPNGAGITNDITSSNFLHPSSAHRARTLQFGLKFLF
jgi:hypothetical protein